jgi:hypothetical protein
MTPTKNTESALATARAVSRALKAGGFKMARKVTARCWTPGLLVSRMGHGTKVLVEDWKSSNEVERGIQYLRGQGYLISDIGIIVCEKE